METKSYKLRIDSHSAEALAVVEDFKHIYAFEGTDTKNPHLQFYFESTLKRDSIVKRIKKLSEYTPGNRFYSLGLLKPEDDSGYLRYQAYLMKESNYGFHGFTPEDEKKILEFQKTIKEEIKIKKASRKSVMKQIEETYITDLPETDKGVKMVPQERFDRVQQVFINEEFMMDCILSFYKERETLIRDFMIISLHRTLCLKYVPSYDYHYKLYLLDKCNLRTNIR